MNFIIKAIGAIYIFELAYCSYNLNELSASCKYSMEEKDMLGYCYDAMAAATRFEQLKQHIDQATKANKTEQAHVLQNILTCCTDYTMKPCFEFVSGANCTQHDRDILLKDYDDEVLSGLITDPKDLTKQIDCRPYPSTMDACPPVPTEKNTGGGANSVLVTNSMIMFVFVSSLFFV